MNLEEEKAIALLKQLDNFDELSFFGKDNN